MKCKECGRTVSDARYAGNGAHICNVCEFLLNGTKMNASVDYSFTTEDKIALWIKDWKVVRCWINNGNISVDIEDLASKNPEDVLEFCRETLIKNNCVQCTKCGEIIPIAKVALTHFAANFCKSCVC